MFFSFPKHPGNKWKYDIISLIIGFTLAIMLYLQFVSQTFVSIVLAFAVMFATLLLFFYNKKVHKYLSLFWIICIEYIISINTNIAYMIVFIIADAVLFYYIFKNQLF